MWCWDSIQQVYTQTFYWYMNTTLVVVIMHISFPFISHAGFLYLKMLVKVGGSLMIQQICSDLQFEGPLMNIQKQKIQWQPRIHPRNSTWNLKIMVSKWTFLFQGLIFRFHVKFRGCTSNMYSKHSMLYIEPLGRGMSVASMLEFWAVTIQQWSLQFNNPTKRMEFCSPIQEEHVSAPQKWRGNECIPDAIKLFTGKCCFRKDYCTWIYIVTIPIACDRTIMMEVNIGRFKWHNLHIFFWKPNCTPDFSSIPKFSGPGSSQQGRQSSTNDDNGDGDAGTDEPAQWLVAPLVGSCLGRRGSDPTKGVLGKRVVEKLLVLLLVVVLVVVVTLEE